MPRVTRDPTLWRGTNHLGKREDQRNIPRHFVAKAINEGDMEIIEDGETVKFYLERNVDTVVVVGNLEDRVVMTTYRQENE